MNSFNYHRKNPPGGFGGYIRHLLIPMDMVKYALKHKFLRPLQLFILLKYNCSGKIKMNKKLKIYLADQMGYHSIRSLNNCLQKLYVNNWLGYNPKSKMCFVRSFDSIRKRMGFYARTGVSYCFTDWQMNEFKGFCIAAALGSLINHQKREIWMTERQRGRSMHIIHDPPSDFSPVSNSVLAKVLNVSLSTAFSYKLIAQDVGGVEILKNWETMPKGLYYSLIKYDLIKKTKVLYDGKNVMIQSVDLVKHNLSYRRRKKIETY